MDIEKPLHVRVAEALGWYDIKRARYDMGEPEYTGKFGRGKLPEGATGYQIGSPHGTLGPLIEGPPPLKWGQIPRYDTDWSATGPLIEKYNVGFVESRSEWCAFLWPAGNWTTYPSDKDSAGLTLDGFVRDASVGETPLIAICELILALKEAGKL